MRQDGSRLRWDTRSCERKPRQSPLWPWRWRRRKLTCSSLLCHNLQVEARMSTGNPKALNQSLPDDLQSVLNELDRTDEEARQLVSGLSEAQLNWHPSPTAWSVAQCLDHLGQINSAYIPALQAAGRHAGRDSTGPHEPIQPGWFG